MDQPVDGSVVRAVGLGRSHGDVDALYAVDLRVRAGTVLGVLGHSGAGKTTLVDLLTTRLRPTRGSATVCGFDVVLDPAAVRARIGVVTRAGAFDDVLSGHDNLVLVARLLGMGPTAARYRADDLIAALGLGGAAARPVGTWPAGPRRRLDLAAALLGAPDVVFLDEPTAGLDPENRAALWTIVGDLVDAGTAAVVTTQHLDEADRLADDIAVLARGTVVATGTPGELRARLGRRTATVTLGDTGLRPMAEEALRAAGLAPAGAGVTVAVPIDLADDVAVLLRALDAADVALLDLTVADPTLADVLAALDDAALDGRALQDWALQDWALQDWALHGGALHGGTRHGGTQHGGTRHGGTHRAGTRTDRALHGRTHHGRAVRGGAAG